MAVVANYLPMICKSSWEENFNICYEVKERGIIGTENNIRGDDECNDSMKVRYFQVVREKYL